MCRKFDHVILTLVLLNAISLACDDPTGAHPARSFPPALRSGCAGMYTERQTVIDSIETGFLVAFTIELILKVPIACSAQHH